LAGLLESGRDRVLNGELILPDAPLPVYSTPVMTTESAVPMPAGHQWLIVHRLLGF